MIRPLRLPLLSILIAGLAAADSATAMRPAWVSDPSAGNMVRAAVGSSPRLSTPQNTLARARTEARSALHQAFGPWSGEITVLDTWIDADGGGWVLAARDSDRVVRHPLVGIQMRPADRIPSWVGDPQEGGRLRAAVGSAQVAGDLAEARRRARLEARVAIGRAYVVDSGVFARGEGQTRILTEEGPGDPRISFRDEWTAPDGTFYVRAVLAP